MIVYVTKSVVTIYRYEFPTKKIYIATQNMMTANIKKLKLPCAKDKLEYFENNLFDLYIYEENNKLYCLSIKKIMQDITSQKTPLNPYTNKKFKKPRY